MMHPIARLLCIGMALAVPVGLTAQTVVFNSDFNIPDNENITAAGFTWVANDGVGIDWDIAGNQFTVTRTDSTTQSGFALTPFSTSAEKSVVITEFDMNLTGTASILSDYKFSLNMFFGNGFPTTVSTGTPTTNGAILNGAVFGYTSVNTHASGPNSGWTLVPGTDTDMGDSISPSTLYTSTQSVLWVMNDSASSYSYTDPNGGSSSVAAGAWDLWIGTDLTVNERAATIAWSTTEGSTDLDIDSMWVRWHRNGGGVGDTLTLDNWSITVVPEPSTYAFIGGLVALGAVGLRRRLRK